MSTEKVTPMATHRFLSESAAKAFTDTTPDEVRADLAHLEDHQCWPGDGARPGWVRALDATHWDNQHGVPALVDYALRYLADQAATPDGVYAPKGDAQRLDPAAYDAVDTVCYRFRRWNEQGTIPTLAASYLVELDDAMGDLESWLLPRDRYENLTDES